MRMHPSSFRVILIKSILLWLVATAGSEFKVIKPLGPKMCERHCNEMTGCSFYKFVRTDLSCHVTDGKHQRPDKHTAVFKVAKKKKLLYGEDITHCPTFARIFHTRRNRLECRKRLSEQKQLTDKAQLLLFQFSSKKGRLLSLKDNSFVPYPHLKGQTLSVAYSRPLKKLFITDASPYQLRFISVNGRDEVIIKKEFRSDAIAVDDRHKLLFLVIMGWPKTGFQRGVYSMTTDGYKFKTLLLKQELDAPYLVVDPYSLRFYVKIYRKTKYLVYTYAGVFLEDLSKCIRFVDSVKGVLYYTEGYELYNLVLSSNQTQLIFKREHLKKLTRLIVYENNIYMNYFPHVSNLEILKGDGTVVRVDTGLKERYRSVGTCLIL